MGCITFGAVLAWTSPVLPQLEGTSTIFTAPFQITSEEGSWIGSLFGIGGISAPFISGLLAKRFGCKKCIIAFALINLIFIVIVMVARDPYTIMVGRFLSGVGVGGSCVAGPMYISEISSVEHRGTMGSFFEFGIYFGVGITASVGAYLNYFNLTLVIGASIVLLMTVAVFLPESPTHLMKINNRRGAEKALGFYRNANYDTSKDLDAIQAEVVAISKANYKWYDLFKSRATRRGLVASLGLTAFQQLTGVSALIAYTVQIFQEADTSFDPYTSSLIIAYVELVSAFIAVFTMELINRRSYLYISTIGVCISHICFGTYFQCKSYGIVLPLMDYIPLTCFISFTCLYAVGMGPVPWMMVGELYSIEAKGPAGGLVTTLTWAGISFATKTFPRLMEMLGPAFTFYLYGTCAGIFVFYILLFVPETRGKTLQQIQLELNG